MKITSAVKFEDLPIDITTIIIDKLNIDDIINLEHAFNPSYTIYVQHGGSMVRFPNHMKIKKLTHGLSNMINCNFDEFKYIPKIYHENLILEIDTLSDVFSRKKRNTRYCSLIGGLIINGINTPIHKSINMNDFRNLTILSLKKANVSNLHVLDKLKKLTLTECNVNNIEDLINLESLTLSNIYSINIRNLPKLKKLICTYFDSKTPTINIIFDLYWLTYVSIQDLPELVELEINTLHIVHLGNFPKLEKLKLFNIIRDNNHDITHINHLKNIKELYLDQDPLVPYIWINKFKFDELENIKYLEISDKLIDESTIPFLMNNIEKYHIIKTQITT